MSEDRLEEIKDWIILTKTKAFSGIRPSNKARGHFAWLISELEKCRKDVADWRGLTSIEQDTGMGWKDRAVKAEVEVERLKEVAENWRSMDQASSLMAFTQIAKAEKQYRHRKWALKEMKDKQALWRNYCGEVSEQMEEAERLKAIIKDLERRLDIWMGNPI